MYIRAYNPTTGLPFYDLGAYPNEKNDRFKFRNTVRMPEGSCQDCSYFVNGYGWRAQCCRGGDTDDKIMDIYIDGAPAACPVGGFDDIAEDCIKDEDYLNVCNDVW